MKRILLNTSFAALMLLQACSSKVYNNKSFIQQVNFEGKRVAILPAEVELTGRMPNNYSESKKLQTEESESKLIQGQIYNQYLFSSKSGGKKKHVDLMNVDQLNSKLQSSGINLRQSWSMNPDSLGKLLGADMVLRVRVKKNRIMSETAAFGIGVATTVLGNILGNGNQGAGVNNNAKTYNMFLDATLTDVNTHTVITKFTHDGDASWNRSPDEIIESSGRKIVRKGVIYAQK
jgi:opacity protein-like surface antigen